MVILYVNHYGWLMGGSIKKGFTFTTLKASAKPFEERQPYNETERIIDYIRNKMGCNVDEVKYKGR